MDNVYKCQFLNMVKYGPMHLPAHLHYMNYVFYWFIVFYSML